MKKKIVRVVIFDENIEVLEKLKNAMTRESIFFEVEINLINEIDELSCLNKKDIFIINIEEVSKNNMKIDFQELSSKFINIFIINKYKIDVPVEIKNIRKVRIISNIEDDRAIAFNILHYYYMKYKNNKKQYEIRKNKEKLKKTIEQFNKHTNKEELVLEIDRLLMEGTNTRFNGYEELRFMIMFCIVNEIKIDSNKNYNYIYEAIKSICKQDWYNFSKDIGGALLLIRKRKRKLYIQHLLEKIKGKQVIEQIILISQNINANLKEV